MYKCNFYFPIVDIRLIKHKITCKSPTPGYFPVYKINIASWWKWHFQNWDSYRFTVNKYTENKSSKFLYVKKGVESLNLEGQVSSIKTLDLAVCQTDSEF